VHTHTHTHTHTLPHTHKHTHTHTHTLPHTHSLTQALESARLHIGLCPQFDALVDKLNAREHLELLAEIRGVPKVRVIYTPVLARSHARPYMHTHTSRPDLWNVQCVDGGFMCGGMYPCLCVEDLTLCEAVSVFRQTRGGMYPCGGARGGMYPCLSITDSSSCILQHMCLQRMCLVSIT
jgi:hypothetical protein